MVNYNELKEPEQGKPVSAHWGKQVVKAIKSLAPVAGNGISIDRTQFGTKITANLPPTNKKVEQEEVKKMPFDAIYNLADAGSAVGASFSIQRGDLYMTYDHHTALINPEEDLRVYRYFYDFDTENEGKWALCIKCKYEDEGEYDTVNTVLPVSWNFEVVDISEGLSSLTEIARLKYYPIAVIESHLTETLPDDWTQGPVKQTWVLLQKSFRMTQVHHGDAWWEDTSGRQAVVAEIEDGAIGEEGGMYGHIIDDTGMYDESIDIDAVELAGGTYYPSGARVIAHPIRVKILGGGFTE